MAKQGLNAHHVFPNICKASPTCPFRVEWRSVYLVLSASYRGFRGPVFWGCAPVFASRLLLVSRCRISAAESENCMCLRQDSISRHPVKPPLEVHPHGAESRGEFLLCAWGPWQHQMQLFKPSTYLLVLLSFMPLGSRGVCSSLSLLVCVFSLLSHSNKDL